MAKKKVQVKVGDVFRIPIAEGSSGFGQLLAKYEEEMLFIVLFDLQANNDKIPSLSEIVQSQPVFMANSAHISI